MIDVKTFQVGSLGTNCYVVTDKATGEALVVDPGGVSAGLMTALEKAGEENIKYILLTHGHYDHIKSAKELSERFDADIVIGEKEETFLFDENLNLAPFLGCINFTPFEADIRLSEGDKLSLGETEFTFIETPGHTVGSGCFILSKDNVIFSGDTLFRESMGRTDFPTGSPMDMLRSLRRLKELRGDYKVYPGHNASTTLSYERENNMYMA